MSTWKYRPRGPSRPIPVRALPEMGKIPFTQPVSRKRESSFVLVPGGRQGGLRGIDPHGAVVLALPRLSLASCLA